MWYHTLPPLKQQARLILRFWGIWELVTVASILKALGLAVASQKTVQGAHTYSSRSSCVEAG